MQDTKETQFRFLKQQLTRGELKVRVLVALKSVAYEAIFHNQLCQTEAIQEAGEIHCADLSLE